MILVSYAIASGLISINAIATAILFDSYILEKQLLVTRNTEVIFGSPPSSIGQVVVTNLQFYSNILYFSAMWGGTIILIRYQIKRLGKLKFVLLAIMPIVYYSSTYPIVGPFLFPSSQPADMSNLFVILFFGYAVMVGGLIISLAFRAIAKAIRVNSLARIFLLLTADGLLMYFIAASATILQTPYPPYGVMALSMVGFSSFLIYVGLYYSAISLVQDSSLRLRIKKSATEELGFIDTISTAEMCDRTHKTVMDIAKLTQEKMAIETGIEPSLSETEVNSYIDEVLRELKNPRNTS